MLRDVALSRKFESLVYAKPVSVLNPEPETALHEVEEEDYHVTSLIAWEEHSHTRNICLFPEQYPIRRAFAAAILI